MTTISEERARRQWMARMDVLMTMSSVALAEGIADTALVLAIRRGCSSRDVLASLADVPTIEAGLDVRAAVEQRMAKRGM